MTPYLRPPVAALAALVLTLQCQGSDSTWTVGANAPDIAPDSGSLEPSDVIAASAA